MLKERNYAAASKYLDSVLRKNSKDIDALMMKGNVLLNSALENMPPSGRIPYNAGSIFSKSIGAEVPPVLPADTVKAIEHYWLQCLKLDTTRNDIRKGLCTIYAMALMQLKLKAAIADLVKHENNKDEEFPYKLTEYARRFKERNDFDGAMEMYKYIATLFPEVAGLRSDIAGEYFYNGYPNKALIWLDSTYNFKTVDETSFLNGAFIYSELGYFDDAQNVLNTYSRIYQRKMDQFYFGLRLFADVSTGVSNTLSGFISSVDTQAYYTEVTTARKVLACADTLTYDKFKELAADKDIPDYYKVLLLSRGIKQFADSCEPYMVYGVFQAGIQNFSAAQQFLDEGERCSNVPVAQREYWQLVYAYTLFKLNDNAKALQYFQQLYNSDNAFYRQAARYYTIPLLTQYNRSDVIKKLMDELVSDTPSTKFKELIVRIAQGAKQ